MPIRLPETLMVSVSGFRGIVGAPLTPELVTAVAAAFGAFLRSEGDRGPVLLGRDSRTSGPMLARAAGAGLLSVGTDVVDLGVVPTPTLLLAARETGAGPGGGASDAARGGSDAARGASGAVGVTASHNPAEWNALKLAGGDGVFLDRQRMERFLSFLRSTDPPRAPWDRIGTWSEDGEAVERHLERIVGLPLLDPEAVRARGFKVAVDCVHGAGSLILPPLLEALGCEVVGIGLEADGRFPRDPEPTAANLGDLCALVRREGAALGIAVDPDVDRLSLVDEEGIPLGEDLTLALAAAAVLGRSPGPVVTNLSTSRVVEDVAEAAGVALERAPVGEVNVARRMEAAGAVVGGEGNGGVILPSLHLTRDAPLAAALVLQHLADEGTGLRAAAERWPSYRIVKEKAPAFAGRLEEGYAALARELGAPEEDRQDGLRLAWPAERRWLHVRPSGTEPIVRLIAEAPEEDEARALVRRARSLLERAAEGLQG